MPTAPAPTDALLAQLRGIDQAHVLDGHETLPPQLKSALLSQLGSLDLNHLQSLVRQYVLSKPAHGTAHTIEPCACYPAHWHSGPRSWDYEGYRAKGIDLIRRGEVAAFTVAGGQGSRLGYDGPKGCYPGGAVTGKPLFACLAEWILAAQQRWSGPGRTIPWYVMTSPLNHEPTRAFFRQHAFFGLREQDVMFFPQGVMPSFDMATGRMLLESPGQLALSPDGHGGSLRALLTSGALDDMDRRGVRHISYTQIDNPLVRVIDPVFLGLHAHAPDSSAEMSSKMVPKAHANEKVGVLCRVDGKTAIVEYSDMPADLNAGTDAQGHLRFNAGNIAVHAISTAFVRALNAGGRLTLPWHRAEKKVGYWDAPTQRRIEPAAPNAVKLETFVFDALPLARSSIVLETERLEEFAPIKNAQGVDSPESCRRIQTRRAARWLCAAGTRVPIGPDGEPNCTLEISPLHAMDCCEMKARPVPAAIGAGDHVAL